MCVGVKMQVKTQPPKTNPPNTLNKGMENFLSPSQKPQEIKPTPPQIVTTPTQEIEDEIQRLQKIVDKARTTLEFSQFNRLAYEKQLKFKLLFIRSKIYMHVMNNNGKSVIVAINPPRWGGSSLRYLLNCVDSWCSAIERQTGKGKIITYTPLGSGSTSDEEPGIFD